MSRAGIRFLLAANRFFPRPALPGETDPLSYARWEYATSDPVLTLWRRAGGPPPRAALDLGCGLGGKTHRLAETAGDGVAWHALDLSADHLAKAGRYHRAAGVAGIAKVRGDAARLPFADASLDRIVSADMLEHLPRPREALREMRRCLRTDGRLLLVFNPWGSPRGSHLADVVHLPWCQLLFDRDTLARAAVAAGEDRARRLGDVEEGERHRAFAASLADHFLNQVFPVFIRDFRRWLREDGCFAVEHEILVGPGPLRRVPVPRVPWIEERFTASYGAVLRPLGG